MRFTVRMGAYWYTPRGVDAAMWVWAKCGRSPYNILFTGGLWEAKEGVYRVGNPHGQS